MKIFAFASSKGGVGKSTGAVFLARALVNRGHRVLVGDMDHNNNATDHFLHDAEPGQIVMKGMYQVLTATMDTEAATWKLSENLSMIPASPLMAKLGLALATDANASMRFRKRIRQTEADFVILDTPGDLSLELSLALYAADTVIVPISASRWTLLSYGVIADEVAKMEDDRERKIVALPSMVSESEAGYLREVKSWTCSGVSIYKDGAIKGAVNAGRGLKEGTRAAGWFGELAKEVEG